MRTIHILVILVLLALAVPASPAQAGGVVAVCDEAHLLAALAGGGTVTFACSGTITLTAEIVIVADTTIDGTGQAVTISGNHEVRVFMVNAEIALNLNGLTVANGNADYGGGIANYRGGSVTVSNSTFSGNRASSEHGWGGGIINDYYGTVTVSNSTFTGNSAGAHGGGISSSEHSTLIVSDSTFSGNSANEGGGGIASGSGTLVVSNSTFSGNSAGGGGGINAGGTVTVTKSTFSGNSAQDEGGAIRSYGSYGGTQTVTSSTFDGNEAQWGGGIYTDAALTVTNSTFAGNEARWGGGGIRNEGTLTVSNSTFSDNSADSGAGGLYNDVGNGGVMTLKNTIVANSVADANCSGTIADGGGNLSYPDTSCPGINADPVLGPLQDNGGPTLTMEPGSGSPAIDTGNDATCAADPVNNLDQRGVVRPQGTHCDIGAVEQLLPFRIWCPLVYAQPASASALVSVCDEAHLLAAITGGGTITFDCSGAITLTTPITITANTTIDGGGQDVTISGNHAVRVFKVNYGATLNLNGLTIADGSATSGAGVLNYGTLALDNSTFSGNSVTCDYCTGGGIFNIGTLSVSNSTFSGNSMPGVFCNGGDIANRWGTVTISNSSFSGNTVNVGGAIFNQSGAVTVTNSTFSGETAGVGGAIANDDGRLMVSNCTFSGNRVSHGGGIYNHGTLIVSDSGFFLQQRPL